MMKEIEDIIAAFKIATQQGRETALATVVHVEGSSYRRPGARMLVEDNGKLTGAISGGCLEGDALRKALLAIHQKQNKLVTYNTLDDDDIAFGIQLGCNGIIHILFEPIDPNKTNHPIALLEKALDKRRDAVVATLFSLKKYNGNQPGTCFYYDGEVIHENIADQILAMHIKGDAMDVLLNKSSLLKDYEDNDLVVFVEILEPPISLVIVGGGNDALPLMEIASVLGWHVTIIDGRDTHANKQRFPNAKQIIVGNPSDAKKALQIDSRTVFVLMTHNYNYDMEMLGSLLQENSRYIGVLGPKKKLEKMLAELETKGLKMTRAQKNKIYGPVGLDIGAEAAEEIAISILSEIKAVLSNRKGSSLHELSDTIHSRLNTVSEKSKTKV